MKRIISLIAVSILFLSINILYADEAAYEKHIAKGIVSLEDTQYGNAESEFRAALKEKPEDPDATLYLGIALSRANDDEAETVLVKALSYDSRQARTNLELGILYFNKGIYDEAKDYFDNTVKFSPNTDLSAKAEEYLKSMGKVGGPKPWILNLSLGEQYDTNVVLGPEDGPKSANVSRESDWRTVLYLKGRYNMLRKQNAESSVAYSIYQSLHNRLSDFNVTQHLFELKGSYDITPALTFKGMYSMEYVYVGGDDYNYAYSISPSLIISEGKGMSSEIEYRYKQTRFMDSGFFRNNSDRTGGNNYIGITQSLPVNSYMAAKAGYSYDEDATAKDFWNYRGSKGFAGLKFYFIKKAVIDLHGEYYDKRYKEAAPAESEEREDKVYSAAVSFTRLLSERFSITAGQLYTRNDSNIRAYDYKRAITSVYLSANF